MTPLLTPRDRWWPMPMISTLWVRPGSTELSLRGVSRPIMQTTLVEPMSSTDTTCARLDDSGFMRGRPKWELPNRLICSAPPS